MSLKNFRALAGLEVELGQTWPQIVQNGPQKLTLRRQGPKTELLGLENFRALAGLEVKLGQTWSQDGPDMVPKNELNRHEP